MNKEQSADDPSGVDLIRVKNMLTALFMSYPDVVIAWQNIRCLWKHSEQLRQRW